MIKFLAIVIGLPVIGVLIVSAAGALLAAGAPLLIASLAGTILATKRWHG